MLSLRDRSSGFTILEVLVAFTMMSTAVVALMGLQTQALYDFQAVQDRMAVIVLAEDRLQRVLMRANGMDPGDMTQAELWEAYGEDYLVEDFELPCDDFLTLPIAFVYPNGWDCLVFRVEVRWHDAGNEARVYALDRAAAVRLDKQQQAAD